MKTAILSFFLLIASVGLFAQSKEELCIYIETQMEGCEDMLAVPKIGELEHGYWLAYFQGKRCAFREILNRLDYETEEFSR